MVSLVLCLAGCDAIPSRGSQLWDAARKAQARGETDRAREHLEALLAWDPRDLKAAEALARLSGAAGHPTQALARLDAVPADVARPALVRRLRAELLFEAGRVEEAVRLWSELEQEGEEAGGLPERRWLEAIARSSKEPDALPGVPMGWSSGVVEALLDQGHRQQDAWSWLQRVPQGPAKTDLARRLQEAALEMEVCDEPWLTQLAAVETGAAAVLLERKLAQARDDLGAARLATTRFLAEFPSDPRRGELLVDQAVALLAAREPEPALERIREAHRLGQTSPRLSLLEARALKWLERPDEARRVLEDARLAFPADHALGEALARESDREAKGQPARDLEFHLEIEGGTAP